MLKELGETCHDWGWRQRPISASWLVLSHRPKPLQPKTGRHSLGTGRKRISKRARTGSKRRPHNPPFYDIFGHSYHTVPAMSIGPYDRPRGVLGEAYNRAQRYDIRVLFTVSNLTPPYAKFQIWNLTRAFTHLFPVQALRAARGYTTDCRRQGQYNKCESAARLPPPPLVD